jgi:3-methyladenine DNA glycosylase/8-oxoguanine DNA glycosylase
MSAGVRLIRVTVTGADLDASRKVHIISALDRPLGRRVDLLPFYSLAARDSRLNHLAQRFYELKPPRFPTIFETIANGVACQQLSLAVGITLLASLRPWGHPFQGLDETAYSRPGSAPHPLPIPHRPSAAPNL